jgi:hypothetical protein
VHERARVVATVSHCPGHRALRNLSAGLESDAKWTVGDPGSSRELVTYLAQVTKVTTGLFENLGGFSSEKSTRAAKEIRTC